jgi:hypothetical protein
MAWLESERSAERIAINVSRQYGVTELVIITRLAYSTLGGSDVV